VRGVQKHHQKQNQKNLTLVLFWPLTHPPTTGVTVFFCRPLGLGESPLGGKFGMAPFFWLAPRGANLLFSSLPAVAAALSLSIPLVNNTRGPVLAMLNLKRAQPLFSGLLQTVDLLWRTHSTQSKPTESCSRSTRQAWYTLQALQP
jgi:hypothetical protein